MSFPRAARSMAQGRCKALSSLRPPGSSLRFFPDMQPSIPRVFTAAFASDFLNLDDLPPPSSMPRSRSFLSNKRSSLARRMAAREKPDELGDFHGLQGSSFEETLERLDRLDKIGIKPHPATYAALLQSAGNRFQLDKGILVHNHIVRYEYHEKDMALVDLILQMYRRCGSPEKAREWFDSRKKKNTYMWTCMIGTYCQYGYRKEALEIYQMLKQEEQNPEKESFLALVCVISGPENMQDGRLIHEHIHRSPYKLDPIIGGALIRMYGRLGSVKDSVKMFRMLIERKGSVWNALMSAYALNDQYRQAADLFEVMIQQDEFPDHVSFSSALVACAHAGDLGKAMQIHSRLPRNALETEKRVMIGFIRLYGKFGNHQEARKIFEEMEYKDVIAWNTLIKSFAEYGHHKQVLSLCDRMKKEGVTSNRVTYMLNLSACLVDADLAAAKDIYSQFVNSGLKLDDGLASAFIFVFGKCGGLQEAREVFDKITDKKSVALWNSMIVALSINGCKEGSLAFFQKMQNELVLDSSKYVSSLGIYGENSLELAEAVFENLTDKNCSVWNTMILILIQHSAKKQAMDLFKKMQEQGVTPNKHTIINILRACTDPCELAEGKVIHSCASHMNLEADRDVSAAIIRMYGKCGSVEEAQGLFERMPTRDVIAWDALIAAYAHNGKCKDALKAFNEMQAAGLVPTKETTVNVLSACETLEESKQLHELIAELGYEFETTVTNALIRMYAKCGHLEGAKTAFNNAQLCNVISWASLIGACARNGQEEEALKLFEKLKSEGMLAGKVTYENVLSAFDQGILSEELRLKLLCIDEKCGILPAAELFSHLEHLLGASGHLNEAERFIYNIPYEPPNAVYSVLTEENKLDFNMSMKLPLY